jgi:hypothetical protein
MFKFFLRLFFFLTGIVTTAPLYAQDNLQREKPQMAEGMRADGKIYVVVAVLLIILTGIYIYLIRLERKINRLEKKDL